MSLRKIQYIRLQGFRSFTESQTFSFKGRPPGVYFLTGKNLSKPSLGGNATGKTTLWEGLLWCLFGKTSRNLRANNIVNWKNEHQCKVTVGIEVDGVMHHIRRSQSPNSLKLLEEGNSKWQIMTEGQLHGLIQLSFDAFLYSVISAQFRDMFLDLKPTEKAQIFSSVMDVERWLKYSKIASVRADECKDNCLELKHTLANYHGQLEALTREDFKGKEDEWEEDREERYQQSLVNEDSLKKEIKEIEKKRSNAKQLIQSRKDEVTVAKKELKELENQSKDLEDRKRKLELLQRDCQKEVKSHEQYIKDLESDNGECSRCGQRLTKAHVRKERRICMDAIKKASADFDEIEIEIRTILIEYNENRKGLRDVVGEISSLERYLEESKMLSVRSLDKLEVLDSELAAGKACSEEILEEESPWTASVKTNEDRASMLNGKINFVNSKIKKLQRKEDNTRYWVKGFKQVRLSLMEELLRGLEIETNNALTEMGLEDWELVYSMEDVSKSGKERKGFFVDVISPEVDHPVPWEVWSGGESQRLRLASAMGLSNFIHYQLGLQWNLEVWDEPSNFLSETGIQSLLDLLQDRAETEQKQVWVVDHRTLDYGLFQQRFTVVKDDEGSFILEED